MVTSRIPLLSRGDYAPLKESLVASFVEVVNGRSPNFGVEFHSETANAQLYFVQGFKLNESTLQLEVSRGESFLPPTQLAANDLYMKATGWTIPSSSREGYPNYIREVPALSSEFYEAADLLIDASIAIGHISPASWFEFGPEVLSNQIVESRTFWHNESDEDLLCLPGQNLGTCREAL